MIAERTILSPIVRSVGDGTSVWGLDVLALHDRFWASRGVQVVRRAGSSPVESRGPELYLLIDRHELIFFDLQSAVQEMRWVKPRLLRLRLVDADRQGYSERVVADSSGRFVAIRRDYRPRTRSSCRVTLTSDPRLAERWARADNAVEGWRELRRAVGGRSGAHPAQGAGRRFDAREPADVQRGIMALVESWTEPGLLLDGIYEYESGVWLHESVRIDGGVRFHPPVWVGAGRALEPGEVLIGPTLVPDDPSVRVQPVPVSWREFRRPGVASFRPPRRRRLERLVKRAFDIVFALVVLIATLPLYPFIILAILREDGRPAFFVHRRQTFRGREFPCLKFRTMERDADARKAELAGANRADGPQFFVPNDPRLLRVGAFLRRYHLDELPQFWNVLAGHMSVVGPRPSPDSENQYCPAWREARLSVRPGITGLWQVRRTREPQTDFQEWIRYDLDYVRRQSLRLDLWIIWQTIQRIVRG